jgi:hypothetical protein
MFGEAGSVAIEGKRTGCRVANPGCVARARPMELVVDEVFVFLKQALLFPRHVLILRLRSERGMKLSGEASSPGFQTYLSYCDSLPPGRKKCLVTILLPSG